MRILKFFFITVLLLFTVMMSAQNIDDHLWNNRIFLVIQDADNPLFEQQLDKFVGLESELQERKILVYQIKANQYKVGLHSKEKWQVIRDPELLEIINDQVEDFEVVLIGLDGGVKQRQSNVMTAKSLFDIVDRMPMRRQEMKFEKGE